jgi:hypothetical protein
MAVTLKFSADQYRGLVAIFAMIKETCEDLTIHQFNDSKTILYDIDLTEYFNESTVYINNIKQTHDLLKLFALTNSEVRLKLDTNKYIWMDSKSKLESTIPQMEALKNPFLDPDQQRAQNTKNKTTKVFNSSLDRTILDRIDKASKTMESKKIILTLNEDSGKFVIIPSDINTTTKFEVHEVDELIDESFRCDIQYDINSFLIQTEELNLNLFKNPLKASTFTMMFDAEVEGIKYFYGPRRVPLA